jgi:hypothetical protein
METPAAAAAPQPCRGAMETPAAAAAPQPCCVCGGPGGQNCAKCKSRRYCSKKCQLVDWKGHKAQCKRLAAKSQDRLLDTLMPEKLTIKEAPAIVDDVAAAAGFKAAARLSAVQAATTAVVKFTALNDDAPSWRGTCAICLDELPIGGATFYDCCCKKICKECSDKCRQHDERCPLCRAPAPASEAEWVRRLQKHADEGNADAQMHLAFLTVTVTWA